MSDKRVVYNGQEMAAEWPARIEAAQSIREYVIGGDNYERIRYGADVDGVEFAEACHDCGVLPGQYHVEGVCDMEECPRCHGQVIGCDCPYEADADTVVSMTAQKDQSESTSWQGLLRRMEPELSGYTVFLETSSGQVSPFTVAPQEKVAGLIIAFCRDGVSPWETEEPIKNLAARLSEKVGLEPVMLMSRRTEPFAGFYLRVRE